MCQFGFYIVSGIFILLQPVEAVIVPLLVFPRTAPTRIQWISGIGIPLDNLKYEAMTTGFVLKAEYFLPENVTQLKIRTVMPFQKRSIINTIKLDKFLSTPTEAPLQKRKDFVRNNKKVLLSSYRWTIYKGFEGLAERMGLSGRDCILKSICEAAETSFHYYNGLVAELLHILLTPSSSADQLSTHSDNEYYHAEHLGRSGANCQRVFKSCPRSLLEHFTDIHHLSESVKSILG
ncbi:hypothetical protein FF38_09279 [Lucilia cuprina]|uniref:Uncharacterized protein n=1 Tax=Lucilia cuprina TaxID=7375 RepID=A0A0L0CFB3_LUCCU|nr:hypothetical protein CVS40_10741 [Lucilia cuprina]KNC30926.1 hypothetical protein FF38_09279 [Lucilia cuprina]